MQLSILPVSLNVNIYQFFPRIMRCPPDCIVAPHNGSIPNVDLPGLYSLDYIVGRRRPSSSIPTHGIYGSLNTWHRLQKCAALCIGKPPDPSSSKTHDRTLSPQTCYQCYALNQIISYQIFHFFTYTSTFKIILNILTTLLNTIDNAAPTLLEHRLFLTCLT